MGGNIHLHNPTPHATTTDPTTAPGGFAVDDGSYTPVFATCGQRPSQNFPPPWGGEYSHYMQSNDINLALPLMHNTPPVAHTPHSHLPHHHRIGRQPSSSHLSFGIEDCFNTSSSHHYNNAIKNLRGESDIDSSHLACMSESYLHLE